MTAETTTNTVDITTETLSGTTPGGLKKTMRLLYVYTLATGAIYTFLCYWDGIFLSYCGPGTALGFLMMTMMVLPIGFVYAELSAMLPSTGSCLVFNTVGLSKHAGFWSAWLIMCAWLAVPAAGVLGIIDWLNYQFLNNGLTGMSALVVGALCLCVWCVVSCLKNVVAGRLQTIMLFVSIAGILLTSLLFFFSGHWSLSNFQSFFANTNAGDYGTAIGWIIGCAFLITPYFGFETVPAMVEEGTFPIKDQKKAILGSVLTCGIIYAIFYFAEAGCIDWSSYAFDSAPFITFDTLYAVFGQGGFMGWFVILLGIFGVLFPIGTSVLGFWYSAVRMLYAMGRQNFLPKAFSKCNRFGQPILPNILILVISIGFLAMQSIRAFFDLMAFACAICYALSSISAIRLAITYPEWKRPYVTPGGMAMKVLSLIIAVVVAFFCTIGIGTETWLGFVGYMVVGLVLWGLMLVKWHRGGKDSTVWMRTPEGVREY